VGILFKLFVQFTKCSCCSVIWLSRIILPSIIMKRTSMHCSAHYCSVCGQPYVLEYVKNIWNYCLTEYNLLKTVPFLLMLCIELSSMGWKKLFAKLLILSKLEKIKTNQCFVLGARERTKSVLCFDRHVLLIFI
jgi:hypothetical protein